MAEVKLRMKDGETYQLTGKSTSRSRSWIGFDENGEAVGVLSLKSGLTKRSAEKFLSRRWPYATHVRAARKVTL